MNGRPCPERLLLPEALSAQLAPAEEKRVMAHLETCPACQDAAAEIEIALVSLAVLRADGDDGGAARLTPAPGVRPVVRPVREPELVAAAAAAAAAPSDGEAQVRPLRRPSRFLRPLLVAAAALVLVGGGAAVGHQVLPPRDTVHYGPALALAPPPGAPDTAARGTVAVATESSSLAVKLKATALPAAGWYECVWIAGGETRSAGSFHATRGAVDVDLRVAAPRTTGGWDLQVLAHDASGTHVVLEGNASYPA